MSDNKDNENDNINRRVIDLEDLIIRWLQVAGLFIATAFVIIGLVRWRQRRFYGVIFFIFSVVILWIIFTQYLIGRSELVREGIEVPYRLDMLMLIVLLTVIILLVIIVDYARGGNDEDQIKLE